MKELLPLLNKLKNSSVRFNALIKDCFTIKTAGDGRTLLINTLSDKEIIANLEDKCNSVKFGLPPTYGFVAIMNEIEKLVQKYPDKTTKDFIDRFFIFKDSRMGDDSDYYCSEDSALSALKFNTKDWEEPDCDAG